MAGVCFSRGIVFLAVALAVAGCSSGGTSAPPVNRTTPAITWAAPASIVYGTPLSSTQLDASASGVAGTFTYAPALGTVLAVGSQKLSVTFGPADTKDYNNASGSVILTVNQATPTLTWATPAPITYPTSLSSLQLDAVAGTAGSFAYSPSVGSILHVGTQTLSVTFTPADATDYTTAEASVMLSVTMPATAISWAAPAAITYGTPLSPTQLDATANVPGSFSYSSAAGTVLTAGVQKLSVTFTPADTANYQTATDSVTLTVNQATPAITWATPADVVQGASLSSAQLDATANVPGSFSYSPAAGTALNTLGAQTLSVTFTPTDTTDYTTASGSVSLIVTSSAGSALVDFGANEQIIRGFGGSTAWLGAMPKAVATALFNPASGLGLNILRVRIDPEGSQAGGGLYGYPYETAEWDAELTNAQEAQAANPNAIVFATPWTPPDIWKLNGTTVNFDGYSYDEAFASSCGSEAAGYCGGYLDPNHYADYANYLEDFVTYFNAKAGFNLYAISMQNEPEENVTYESCVWTPQQMDTWVANDASTVVSDPYSTKLIMPESNDFNPVDSATALEDSNAEGHISIVGGHIYEVLFGGSIEPYSWPAGVSPKELWMTEFGPLSTATPTWAEAVTTYAPTIHQSMVTGQYSAYVWWGIFGAPTNAGTYGLVDDSGNPTVFGNMIGQFSKFVRPGYYRYDATAQPSASVYVSAYAGTENTTQHYVIVAINAGSSAVSQSFNIQNATVTTLTPYQTTATAGLAQQSTFTVTGSQFTYSLPAQSITTFVQ